MKKNHILPILIMTLICTLLTACSKINQQNYDKLSLGMEYPQVVTLIGQPNDCQTTLGIKKCHWGNDNQYIKVAFVMDKATIFSNKGL